MNCPICMAATHCILGEHATLIASVGDNGQRRVGGVRAYQCAEGHLFFVRVLDTEFGEEQSRVRADLHCAK